MRRRLGVLGLLSLLAGCAAPWPGPSGGVPGAYPGGPGSIAACSTVNEPVTIDGVPRLATATSCEQPDGSWRIVQQTPGLPNQVYALPPPASAPVPAPATPPPEPAGAAQCREFTVSVTVGGQPVQAVGEACRQPDGSWRISQQTPGLPTQTYVMPAATYAEAYPYWAAAYPAFPYEPWFFGFGGSFLFVGHFHHFGHGGFRHRGFGHRGR